ncbi:uncharacterized protein AB675_41 [Cyphellophora attinorum]|uniref:Uncharacterized protein n=1 Tax=Cyphellophora attinorum TaxID=1664694 RepID=A0A0N1NW02_9EURO|nr:uncharacterized protein AB675_41 [Phialophora attinorum]KPI34686.1 hypothetical protein AB675_41 [Phialophora attinorum]
MAALKLEARCLLGSELATKLRVSMKIKGHRAPRLPTEREFVRRRIREKPTSCDSLNAKTMYYRILSTASPSQHLGLMEQKGTWRTDRCGAPSTLRERQHALDPA